MPQVNRNRHTFALIVLCIALMMAGCGKSNSQAPFNPDTGRHNGNWSDPQAIGSARFHATAIIEVSGPEGAGLFAKRCAICHGNSGAGKLAPNILNETAAFISAAINVVPLMKGQSDLTLNQIQAIADYIAALSGGAAPVSRVINTTNCQGCHGSGLNGGIAVVSCFSCHNGPSGDIGHPAGFRPPNIDSPVFHGNFGDRFRASCTTCHGLDFGGAIGPSCAICHDGTVAPVLDFIQTATVGTFTTIITALSGAEEVPPVAGGASGSATLTVNIATRAISGSVTFTGLSSSATAAHIHQAVAGVNGPVIVALAGGAGAAAGTWTVPSGTVLTPEQFTAFQAGGLYFNIHTATNLGGEIRGQILFP